MRRLRRLVLVRHGETEGNSSVRFHGRSDVPLSARGREQMREVRRALGPLTFDLVGASPLRRAIEGAWIVGGGVPVRLFAEFAEIDFGIFEGLTLEEIRARYPVAFEDWQADPENFEFPGGESREAFRARVGRGVAKLLAEPLYSALLVIHKGVIREMVRQLAGQELDRDRPGLGQVLWLTREDDGKFALGRHASLPPALDPFCRT